MKVKHDGTTYSCNNAIYCDDDHFLTLFDAEGNEVISFYGVQESIFTAFEFSGGTPMPAGSSTLTKVCNYVFGNIWIEAEDFTYDSGRKVYHHSVVLPINSFNFYTFNIDIRFESDPVLKGWEHNIEQTSNGFTITAPTIPINGVHIESVLITKVSNV